jgi:putative ABC transport system permease protein
MNPLHDLRFALRGWKKSPVTTAVLILALALGIGVNAGSFMTVNAIILHPLPYPKLDRIVTVWEAPAGQSADREPVAPANFFDWREQSRSFEALAAYRPWDANLTGAGEPERVAACLATPEFFQVLGLAPALGRTYSAAESGQERHDVVVVSQGFWKRRLAGDPAALGKTVSLDGAAYTVVGVMPEDFNFPLETDVWAPIEFPLAERHDRESHSLAILGRLKPAVPLQQARAEMASIGRRLAVQYPVSNRDRGIQVIPVRELTNNVTDRFVLTLLATAGFVLLLAAANVANLLLVRLANRQREIAVRTAMGATRFGIVRLLVFESVLLALVSGGIGLYLADLNRVLSAKLIPPWVLRYVAGIRNMRIDGTVVLFTIGVSLAVGLLSAIPAAVHVLRGTSAGDLNEALKEGGRGGSAGRAHSRLRSTLAISEVALALILLVGAGVMVGTFQRMLNANPGFDTHNLLTLRIALAPSKYAASGQVSEFFDRLLQGLGEVPSARSAAVSGAASTAQGVYIEGRAAPVPGDPRPSVYAVTGQYLRTLRLPLIQGRPIGDGDGRESQPVVVVSQSVARHYWPASNPIGSRLKLSANDPRWLTVVGVCGDVKDWFASRPEPRVYVSFEQAPSAWATVFLRTSAGSMQVSEAVRAEVRKVDRGQPVFDLKTMEQAIAEQTSGVRASAVTMETYAAIALFLAVSGIYAVISYSVAQRTREIGIRMALGAGRADILAMALAGAVRMGAIGLAIGVPVTLAMLHTMSSVLYGVMRIDAATFLGLTLLLAFSAVAAGYIPAHRAARVDPLTALRAE